MFKPLRKNADLSGFADSYSIALFDSSLAVMYGLTSDLIKQLDKVSRGNKPRDIAQELFDLFRGTISYGSSKRTQGYANAKQVWRNKEGVCGEMSYLYVAAARYCGLRSSYASVTEDYSGKAVHHACAAVWIPHLVLVDIAYSQFDVKHIDFSLRSDRDVLRMYDNWKQKK